MQSAGVATERRGGDAPCAPLVCSTTDDDRHPVTSHGQDHSSDSEIAVNRVVRVRRHLRRRRRESSSSDELNDDVVERPESRTSSDESSDGSSDHYSLPAFYSQPHRIPKDLWPQLSTLTRREMGYGPRNRAYTFRTQCYASLSLVERLERQAKLKHHKGCVNSLHFNQSGQFVLP